MLSADNQSGYGGGGTNNGGYIDNDYMPDIDIYREGIIITQGPVSRDGAITSVLSGLRGASTGKTYGSVKLSLDVQGLPQRLKLEGEIAGGVNVSKDRASKYRHNFTLTGTPSRAHGTVQGSLWAHAALTGRRPEIHSTVSADAYVRADPLPTEPPVREIVQVLSASLEGPGTLEITEGSTGTLTLTERVEGTIRLGKRTFTDTLNSEEYSVAWDISGTLPEGISFADGSIYVNGTARAGRYEAEISAEVSVRLIDGTVYTETLSKQVTIIIGSALHLIIGPGFISVNDYLDTLDENEITQAVGLTLGPDIRDVSGIERMPGLRELYGEGCSLNHDLIISDDVMLEVLDVRNTGIYTLRVPASLVSLDCGLNHLTRLELGHCEDLVEAKCEGQTREVDLRELSGLGELGITDITRVTGLTGYDDEGNPAQVNYDPDTGELSIAPSVAVIRYEYVTGFDGLTMDVLVADVERLQDWRSSGGCNYGTGALALAVLVLMRKR